MNRKQDYTFVRVKGKIITKKHWVSLGKRSTKINELLKAVTKSELSERKHYLGKKWGQHYCNINLGAHN